MCFSVTMVETISAGRFRCPTALKGHNKECTMFIILKTEVHNLEEAMHSVYFFLEHMDTISIILEMAVSGFTIHFMTPFLCGVKCGLDLLQYSYSRDGICFGVIQNSETLSW